MISTNSTGFAVIFAMFTGGAFVTTGCGHDPLEGDLLVLEDEVFCENPHSSGDRFTAGGAIDGVSPLLQQPTDMGEGIPVGVGLAAVDVDDDGDIDLLFPDPYGVPQVFENDGFGAFVQVDQTEIVPDGYGAAGASFIVADFTGDGRPDVIGLGHRIFLLSENLGGLNFGPFTQAFISLDDYVGATLSASAGDVDGDGDLDLLLPGLDRVAWEPPELNAERHGSADRLLINNGHGFEIGWELIAGVEGGLSMSALHTDRDLDGDLDILVPSINANLGFPSTAFYRNEVAVGWSGGFVEDSKGLNADISISGMGIDSADITGDGLLDYCMSDLNGVRCLINDGDGGYYEGASALGLQLSGDIQGGWSGWSVDINDLDNDGHLDMVSAAGNPFDVNLDDGLDYQFEPDQLWMGVESGFQQVDFGGNEGSGQHYGLVTADLNGDGFLEIIATGNVEEPTIWWNTCDSSAWIEIDLAGPSGNHKGIGVRIELDVNDKTLIREVHSLRGFGQGPARIHFGLNDATEIDAIRTFWPDGTTTETFRVPVNRRVTAFHPEAITIGEIVEDTGLTTDTGVSGYGTIRGEVTRDVELVGDGIGTLYIYLFDQEPTQGSDFGPITETSIPADFSDSDAAYEFSMMGIIARIEPYYLTLYLDDDDSGPRGPTSGDLLATPFGGQDLSVEIHGDGDVIVNPVLNEVNP